MRVLVRDELLRRGVEQPLVLPDAEVVGLRLVDTG